MHGAGGNELRKEEVGDIFSSKNVQILGAIDDSSNTYFFLECLE